jgi:hypothetical protein
MSKHENQVLLIQFIFNRQLLKNIFIFVFVLLFILQTIYVTCHERFNSYSSYIPSSLSENNNKTFFKHLQSFSYPVSCQNLFEGDPSEFKHVQTLLTDLKSPKTISDDQYNITKEQCYNYRSERFNQLFHREDSSTNQQFPLAFNILMYENVEQFERLLRVLYRPQNFYCIHVDRKASSSVFEGVKSIVQCFDNVYLVSKREKVLYATFLRLQADLNCMQDSLKHSSWKYLLNVASSELPLKTNSELVKILSIYRGYNDLEGIWKKRNIDRTDNVWEIINTTSDSHGYHLRRTNITKKPPPGNVTIIKGSAYGMCLLFLICSIDYVNFQGAFSRAFVEFIQTNSVAKELLEWSRDTYSPDEHYWATLNYNTHLNPPGGYKGIQ